MDKVFANVAKVEKFRQIWSHCYLGNSNQSAISHSASVTRIDENSPLWQNFIKLFQMVEALFSVQQNFEPTFGKILMI